MEAEQCVRGDGEEIRNVLHRRKKIVDKECRDDMEGIAEGDRAAERQAQGGQRRQRYIDYTLRGLRPRYLQRKTQEYLMENPNATWNDFSTSIIQTDVSYQVSQNFLNDEEQTKVELASLGKEMKNFCSELQEHQINALENSQQPDPNQKSRQNATRFCNYCRTNGHTPNWCLKRKNIRRIYDECNMMCPSKRMLLLHGTEALATLTVNPITVNTQTDLWIHLMETTQLTNFSLLKEKLRKMEVTS